MIGYGIYYTPTSGIDFLGGAVFQTREQADEALATLGAHTRVVEIREAS